MSREGAARRHALRHAAGRLLLIAALFTLSLDASAATSRAGSDQTVLPGAAVMLDGSASISNDGSALTYAWRQLIGPPTALTDPAAAATGFVAPQPAAEWVVLAFELRVTEASGASDTDTVTIMVSESLAPNSRLKIVSPPGEIVGQGISFEIDFAAASFVSSSNAESILQIEVRDLPAGGTSPLSLTLARPDEQPLEIGHYESAYRNGTRAGKPSLSARRGIFCTTTVGTFVIHDIGFDESGALTRLAVDFKQYCYAAANPELPFTGYLRFNSVVPVLSRRPLALAGDDLVVIPGRAVTLTADASLPGAPAIVSTRWVQLSGPSLPGLPSSAPRIQFVAPQVPATGTTFEFELTLTNAEGAVSSDRVNVHVQGSDERKTYVYLEVEDTGIPDWVFGTGSIQFETNYGRLMLDSNASTGTATRFTLDIAELHNWHITFDVAAGDRLRIGDYPDVEPSATNEHPQLNVGGNGRGYNRTYGFAVIHDIEFAADGSITSLAMDFNYKGDTGPRVYGVVRINSRVEFVAATSTASAGPDQPAIGGDYVRLGPELTYVGSVPIVEVSWTQVGGPAVQLSWVTSTIVFFTAPDEGGEFEFELTVRTSDGRASTSRVMVRVAPSGTIRSVFVIGGDQGEPLTRGAIILEKIEEPNLLSLSSIGPAGFEVLLGATSGTFPTAYNQAYMLLVAPRRGPMELGTLVPGSYENSFYYRQTHDIIDRPFMTFGVNGLSCIGPRGRFVVYELERDMNRIHRLAADVQQTCEPDGRYLSAQVRLNSAIPIRSSTPLVTAGHDLVVRAGREFQLDGQGSGSWSDPRPGFQWRSVAGAGIQIAQPGSRVALATAAILASGQAQATAELEVTDASGRRASDRVDITILGADQPAFETDFVRIHTASGTLLERLRHDRNNAYFQTAGQAGFRERTVNSVSRHGLYLTIQANVEDRVPTGHMKVTDGSASDFSILATRVRLAEIDEFNAYAPCDSPNGAMRVAEAELAADGFSRLAVDLDLRCPNGWTYRGSSRFNSAAPVEHGRVFAYAGADREVIEGSGYTLDGTASLIVQAGISDYRWRQLAGPTVALTTAAPGVATLTLPQVNGDTALRFELEVIGEKGERGTDEVTIIAEDVSAPPPPPPPPGGGGGGGGGGGAIPLWLLAGLSLLALPVTRRRRAAVAGG